MTSRKFYTNIVFACIVCVLALTAAAFLYLNSDHHTIQETLIPDAGGKSLPKDHPPVDYASRLQDLEQMAVKDTKNADVRAQIGNIYFDLGQYDKAVIAYQQSLDLQAKNPLVETDLATCFHYLGQHDKALELFNKVLQYSPNFSQAMYNKGIILISNKNDLKGGLSVWEDLLRSNPNFPGRAELEQRIQQLKASLK
jgi:tetratricopeptide (TPR) repeat protein